MIFSKSLWWNSQVKFIYKTHFKTSRGDQSAVQLKHEEKDKNKIKIGEKNEVYSIL